MRDDDFTEEELAAAAAKEEAPPPEAETKEEAPEGEAVEAEKPEGEAEPAPDEAKVKTVPHEALHAERMARRRIENELAAERAARERERERLDKIEAMLRGKPEGEPVADDDPIAVLKSVQQQQQALLQTQQQRDEAERAAAEDAFVVQTLAQAEVQFRGVKPDYDAAAEFLWQSRVAEFQLWGLDPAEAEAATRQEIGQWSRQALSAGRSPAELFYGLAETRGYRTAATPAPVAAVEPVSGVAKVQQVRAVQQQARSISSAAGAAPAGDVNIRALLDMDDDEFSKVDLRQFKRVAGG